MTGNMTNKRECTLPIYIERIHDPLEQLSKKSYFLFGPRQTGKTYLIRRKLEKIKIYDLLDISVYLSLSQNPGRIEQELKKTRTNYCNR